MEGVKKAVSEKRLEALKKARKALEDKRDENRYTLHEKALDDVIEKKVHQKLTDLQQSLKKPEPPKIEELPRRRKPVVEESETESEEPPVKLPPRRKPEPKPRPQRQAPTPPVYEEPVPQYRQLNVDLFRNVFGR